jgi:hypothetical protein
MARERSRLRFVFYALCGTAVAAFLFGSWLVPQAVANGIGSGLLLLAVYVETVASRNT